jgi:hypothetical protein
LKKLLNKDITPKMANPIAVLINTRPLLVMVYAGLRINNIDPAIMEKIEIVLTRIDIFLGAIRRLMFLIGS